ncbi:uncharacterized protein LOC113217054 [Frankliniella occidentalis]|uniref:Uncharacterized protein LOC113217054 n=1 Tax=Frankliniella occidentalis TaxID=133901 RepID=A0A6J1TGR9_FRAOC|nr:uncharacterized protein LOC113217054 [Frankliniella occidentalis]
MAALLALLVLPGALAASRARTAHLAPAVDIGPLPVAPAPRMPDIPDQEVSAFISWAEASLVNRFEHLEPSIVSKGVMPAPGTPAWFMAASHSASGAAHNLTHVALVAEEATKYMAQALELSPEQVRLGGPSMDVANTTLGRGCPLPREAPCPPRKYRAYSGHCNNVQRPLWGAAHTRYSRFLSPVYADGVSLPRGTAGPQLPSARAVSLAVHRDSDQPHRHVVALLPVWADLVAHDLAHTPRMAGFGGRPIKCCGVDFSEFHPECFPIRLPDDDPVFKPERCQEYARSAAAPRTGCTLGAREQLNQATSFLDGSAVYGSSREAALRLRELRGGLLRTQAGPDGPLMPADDVRDDCRPSRSFKCFLAGDARANEHLGAAAVHTLLVREHNRVAAGLAAVNPHWADETLFQEARRVVAAELQHITYTEFLPVLLGQTAIDSFGLRPMRAGFYSGYDIDLNPSVANVVAAAALWYSATLMPRTMNEYDGAGGRVRESSLAVSFYAPFGLHARGALAGVVRGMLLDPAQQSDAHINSVMTNSLFHAPGQPGPGLDLAAQLIQQGRDHGLPPYADWVSFCGGEAARPRSFRDLEVRMSAEAAAALQSVYANVSDVDLLPAALSERPVAGALVGPTLACLLGRQFHYLRRGDRFWYENDLPPSAFTAAQLDAVRRASLARLLCDNAGLSAVQPSAFLALDPFLNHEVDCSAIPAVPLDAWRAERPYALPFTLVNRTLLEDALAQAHRRVEDVHEAERQLWRQRRLADSSSPQGQGLLGFSRPRRQALSIANTSLVLEFATARFVSGFLEGHLQDVEGGASVPFTRRGSSGAPEDVRQLQQLLSALSAVDVSQSLAAPREEGCDDFSLPCDPGRRYRSFTGWCNNLRHPHQGKSLRAFNRLLPPQYGDGVGAPRQLSVKGAPLPSPRLVSFNVHPDNSAPHTRYALMVMQFAQIMDHDLTNTPVYQPHVGDGVLVCRPCDSARSVHPLCFPIPIPADDPFFPSRGDQGEPLCLPVTRSTPGQLTLGHREQLNQLTAYIDGSFMYGSDPCTARSLRALSGGRLNVTLHPAGRGLKPLLPQIDNHPECKAPSGHCFFAGDPRSSEQPGLTVMHTLWLREHNHVAERLQQLNPHWADETLYQEARRVVTAQFQHIAFNEFLPRILGYTSGQRYDIKLLREGYFHGYDPTCDATLVNEFSSAAFRFGHSLLQPHFVRMDAQYRPVEPPVRLRDHFFNSDIILQPGMVDEIVRGLVATPMQTLDKFITKEVTNHLFEHRRPLRPFSGFDLVAINIQRSRDHGVPGYNNYRELCNMTRAARFEDLLDVMEGEQVEAMRRLYASPDDIDLFPGGMSERPLPGGVIGPTLACIVGGQFGRLRRCDRFWYETGDPLLRFTEGQLTELRQTSLARIVCNNLDRVDKIQRNVLDIPDPFLNPRVSCADIPIVDLTEWKERPKCSVGRQEIPVGDSAKISPCVECSCTREGPVCQSLRVTNCVSLVERADLRAVLRDDVCRVQCAFLLRPDVLGPLGQPLGADDALQSLS